MDRKTVEKVEAILELTGMTISDLLRVLFFLVDEQTQREMLEQLRDTAQI